MCKKKLGGWEAQGRRLKGLLNQRRVVVEHRDTGPGMFVGGSVARPGCQVVFKEELQPDIWGNKMQHELGASNLSLLIDA